MTHRDIAAYPVSCVAMMCCLGLVYKISNQPNRQWLMIGVI